MLADVATRLAAAPINKTAGISKLSPTLFTVWPGIIAAPNNANLICRRNCETELQAAVRAERSYSPCEDTRRSLLEVPTSGR